jgi:Xaa-Pro aminopeptidase
VIRLELFEKVNSIIIPNYHSFWVNPIINKYFDGKMNSIEGTLILRKNKKEIFISHPFYYKEIKKQYGKKYIIENYKDGKEYSKLLQKYCKGTIGYNGKYNSVNMLSCMKKCFKGKKVKWKDVSEEIDANREIKSKNEIIKIQKAVIETKKVIKKIKNKLKKGISEKEIEILFRNEFEKNGFEMAFCIIAFGKNTLNLHHASGRTKLVEGPVLIDVGAKYEGYCADISESFWFGKKQTKIKTKYMRELNFVKDKLKIIENQLKPGIKAKELMKYCEGLAMPHALGHGLGLEEHDQPAGIGKYSNWKLKEGMILAIEPGTYLREFGIRVERDYLITKKGFKEL